MMDRTVRGCCFLVCLLAGISCSTAEGISQSPAIEDFYCENSYTNFASGYQHRGVYVDGQGHVFAFGSDAPGAKPWNPTQPESPTRQDLEDKYSNNRREVGTVEAQRLTEVRRWLDAAQGGPLSKKVQKGADMGAMASACWVREAGSDRYKEIELDVAGDWSYKNTAPAAAELVRWLASVAKNTEGRLSP